MLADRDEHPNGKKKSAGDAYKMKLLEASDKGYELTMIGMSLKMTFYLTM